MQREQYKPWYLIGIVSFGSKKCGSGVPGIYTRVRNERYKGLIKTFITQVAEFIPWIEKKMLLKGM